jgi:hypothetical protein
MDPTPNNSDPTPSEAPTDTIPNPTSADDFESSELGALLTGLVTSPEEVDSQVELDKEGVAINVMRFRALIARLRVLEPNGKGKDLDLDLEILELLDPDIVERAKLEDNPDLAVHLEYDATLEDLRELANMSQVMEAYREMYNTIHKSIHQAKKGLDIYLQRALSPENRMALASQLSRLFDFLIKSCDEETQNTHNQVVREGRSYRESDSSILLKLKGYRDQCTTALETLKRADSEAVVSLRRDEIIRDQAILSNHEISGEDQRNNNMLAGRYIMTRSREKLMFGRDSNEKPTLSKSMMSSLRSRKCIELYGPTGTGKTHLARHAAMLFTGKEAVVVPGSNGTAWHHFFGSASDLGERNEGALINCARTGKVMIIDEDNNIDPRVLSALKPYFDLQPGETFPHPDTQEEITVAAGFGIIVTRNEKNKHHKGRQKLAHEYRRVFSHGSFEVPYFEADEIYDHFLIPRLATNDGKIHTSNKEFGGKHDDPNNLSPLAAFTQACKEIQDAYCTFDSTGLRSGVFDSGWEMAIFHDWQEQRVNTNCTLLEFLEFKLLDKVNQPGVEDSDRKKIIAILFKKGFFRDKKASDFSTLNSPQAVTDSDIQTWKQGSTAVFKPVSRGEVSSARVVAMADPWDNRKVEYQEHEDPELFESFTSQYSDLCTRNGILQVTFSPITLGQKKAEILKSLVDHFEELDDSDLDKQPALSMLALVTPNMDDKSFMTNVNGVL